MKRSRRTLLISAAAIALSAGSLYYFASTVQMPRSVTRLYEGDAVKLTVANAVTKQKWMLAAAESFMQSDIRTADGQRIEIEISGVLSGESTEKILNGTLLPVAWSPGEQVWADQLAEGWQKKTAKPIMSAPCTPTIYAPAGFAIWRPMAEALGWPDQQIGWDTIIALANHPEGWGSLGHPEWGRLTLGHAHPQYSNAGLFFLSSAVYGILGKTTGITPEDIYGPEVEQGLRTLGQNTAKYGMISTDLLNQMAISGPGYLHVVSAFEEGTVRFNIERKDDLRWPLAFVFPKDGTFWSDQPYCILDGANWVSPAQAEAARLFRDYLQSPDQQARATEFYLRPLDTTMPLGAALSVANGTDPTASPETTPALGAPDIATSKAIIDQFLATKRKATVLLVLDVSGSMQTDNRIRTATEATKAFLERLDGRDRVGLMEFSTGVRTISPIRQVSDVAEKLAGQVVSLKAAGATSLYDAVCAGNKLLDAERKKDASAGEARLYGMVVLSDGLDSGGGVSKNAMMQTCLPQSVETEGIRVFSIAFGGESDVEVLKEISRVTGGSMFEATPQSIDAAYLKISAEQ